VGTLGAELYLLCARVQSVDLLGGKLNQRKVLIMCKMCTIGCLVKPAESEMYKWCSKLNLHTSDTFKESLITSCFLPQSC